MGTGCQGLDRDGGSLGGRCTRRRASISFCFSCTNAIVETLEVGSEFSIGFGDLVGEGEGIFDLVAQTSREGGLVRSIVPLGVGNVA